MKEICGFIIMLLVIVGMLVALGYMAVNDYRAEPWFASAEAAEIDIKQLESGIQHYPAEPNRTIKATIITNYCVKAIWPEMGVVTGTYTPINNGIEWLPNERKYCNKCKGWGFVRKYIKEASNRLIVETKKITRPKKNFSCDQTIYTRYNQPIKSCCEPLTDGAVIIQYKWEKPLAQ